MAVVEGRALDQHSILQAPTLPPNLPGQNSAVQSPAPDQFRG